MDSSNEGLELDKRAALPSLIAKSIAPRISHMVWSEDIPVASREPPKTTFTSVTHMYIQEYRIASGIPRGVVGEYPCMRLPISR